eukprot:234260_1
MSRYHSQVVNITILGVQGVGKSAITVRMVANEWLDTYDPTIEANYTCTICVDTIVYTLDITDTAGSQNFEVYPYHHIRNPPTNFMLVYDILSLQSFQYVKTLHRNIIKNWEGQRTNFILVGNKCDLKLTDDIQVKREDAIKLSRQWNISYIETSAKLVKNLDCLKHMFLFECWRAYTISGNELEPPDWAR